MNEVISQALWGLRRLVSIRVLPSSTVVILSCFHVLSQGGLNVSGLEISPVGLAGSSVHLALGIRLRAADHSLLSWDVEPLERNALLKP